MSKSAFGEAGVRQGVETQMRGRTLGSIERVLEQELTAVLDTGRCERGDARLGYRNGRQAPSGYVREQLCSFGDSLLTP